MPSSNKPWHRWEWFILDSLGRIRATFVGCLQSEAQECAGLLLGESVRAVPYEELDAAQRLRPRWFPPLTLVKAAKLGGFPPPINREERDRIPRRQKYLSISEHEDCGTPATTDHTAKVGVQ